MSWRQFAHVAVWVRGADASAGLAESGPAQGRLSPGLLALQLTQTVHTGPICTSCSRPLHQGLRPAPRQDRPPRFEQVLPHNRPHTVPEAPSRRPQALFEFALPPAPGFSCSWSNSERILLPGREAEPHLRSEHSGRPAQCEPRGGHRNTKLRGRPGSARRAK